MIKKSNLEIAEQMTAEPGVEPRLKFLTEFMSLTGERVSDVARTLEMTRAGVAHWFTCDDTKLSYCQQYIERKGYELIFSLMKDQVKVEASNVNISIQRKAVPDDDVDCERLQFLQLAMKKNGITKVDIAQKLGLQYNSVRHWFVVDDIYVSHIFNIAHIYGFKVDIQIKPKED